jgi:hypothetical protein
MSPQLTVSAGDETEDLARFIFESLDDETLDEIEVDRTYAPGHGLANEPITIAVLLTLGPTVISGVSTLIGKWIDGRQAERQLKLEIAARGVSGDAAALLTELARRPGVEFTDDQPADGES